MRITLRQLRKIIYESIVESTSHVVGGEHYAQVGNYEVYVKDVIDTLKTLKAPPVQVPIENFASVNITRPENVIKYIEIMQQGGWDWDREPLYGQFWNDKVYMFDGNHRAEAGIKSGVYTHLPVVNVDPVLNHVFKCVDQGIPNNYEIRARKYKNQ